MKKLYISICLMLFSATGFTQNWKNFDTINGLTGNSAMVVASDKHNNIWVSIGTGSEGVGLDKFDGTSWIHYDSTNSGLPENDVEIMRSDTSGNLWISYFGGSGTSLNGLTKFDGLNWTIYDTTNSGILSNYIFDIQVDKKNNIWIGCKGGISKFDGTQFTNYHINFPYTQSGTGLIIEDSSSIWIGSFGLMHYNPITDTLILYDESNSNIPSYSVSSILRDTNGLIWLGFNFAFDGGIGYGGTNGGIATFNGTTFTPIWPFNDVYTGVYGMAVDASNNIWVSTRCEGLYKFDGLSWSQIQGVPLNGCSFSVTSDMSNYIWYSEVTSGVWTNNMSATVLNFSLSNIFNIYPNPANDNLTIETPDKAIIEIIDIEGQLIKTTNTVDKQTSIDVSNLSSGVYIIKAKTERGVAVKKFIKE